MAQQICTFFLDRRWFGIPIDQVQEVIRAITVARVPLSSPDICGLINLRNQIVTVIDLHHRLGLGEAARSPLELNQPAGFNVIVQRYAERVGLFVEDVGDVLEFAEAKFEPPPAALKGSLRQFLVGVYPIENDFLLVLDIDKVLNINHSTPARIIKETLK
ncbi:MAG: chemotaxis protein CheW [Chroococcidiopsidaceae cyanobacterium CP_BM_RX_35]|nr:chemotaxis protein CheW [Chroococcidiopsidaceae cyanobacterium CP_BM_RX_35]